VEHWVDQDPRLTLCLIVSTSDPRLAGQEIDWDYVTLVSVL
jgi:hypothetical protein